MSAVTVDYILNLKGNASKAIDDLKRKMEDLGKRSNDLAREMNKNQNLAMFESMASIFTQFGGTISQVSIIATTAARPLTVLSQIIGTGGMVAVGSAASIALLAAGMVKATSATMAWIGEMTKLRKELVDNGYIANGHASNLINYERATERASVATDKLKIEIADKLAPAFQELVDAGTGVVRMLGDLDTTSSSSYGSISKIAGFLSVILAPTPAGAALASWSKGIRGFAAGGQDSNAKYYDRFNPLLSPLAPGSQYTDFSGRGISGESGGVFVGPTQNDLEVGGDIIRERDKAKREAEARKRKAESDLLEEISRALAMADKEKELIDRRVKAQIETNDMMLQIYYDGIEFQKETEKIIKEMDKATRDFQRNYAASDKISMEGGLEGVVTSAAGGGSGILGPIGVTVGLFNALVDELFNLPDLINQTLDNALRVFLDLPELVFELAGLVVPRIIRAIPEIVSGFILIAPAVVWEFIKAAPIIFSSIFEALFQLPEEFIRQLKDAFQPEELLNILRGFRQMWGGLTPGGLLKESFTGQTAARKERSIFGIKIPSFDTGGMVGRDGLAYLHAGERVLNRSETRNYNGGSVGAINVFGVADARSIAEDLRNKLGPYGLNLSLSPRV